MSLLHRREGIIISTIEALHEVGIQNLSTKEIARREGVSEGTLFRHFKNKTDILLGVFDHFSQYDDDIIQACVNRNLNPIDTIINYMTTYAVYYQNYPEITSIIHSYNSFISDSEISERVIGIYFKRINFIYESVEKAKIDGLIDSDIDSNLLTDLLIGGFRQICLRWRIDKYNFSLKDKSEEMVKLILEKFVIKDACATGGVKLV
jgi:AcrR family transcriptional regulator